MFSDEEKELICEYSLESIEKLKISLAAHAAYEKIHMSIIKDFSVKLEDTLKTKITGNWRINNEIKENRNGRWSGLYIQKDDWGDYQIGIQPQGLKYTNFYIGVAKEKGTPDVEGLYEKLQKIFKDGEKFESWNWWQWLKNDYRNWTNDQTLLTLYKNNKGIESEAIRYFSERIFKIQDAATELIDAQVRNINGQTG